MPRITVTKKTKSNEASSEVALVFQYGMFLSTCLFSYLHSLFKVVVPLTIQTLLNHKEIRKTTCTVTVSS